MNVQALSWSHGMVVNLSAGGACLIDTRPDTPLVADREATFDIGPADDRLSLAGTVRWVRKSATASATLIGVQFETFSPDVLAKLEEMANIAFPESEEGVEAMADAMDDSPPCEAEADDHSPIPMHEVVDLYQVLGLRPDASESQIRVAFRREAARWHPDTCKSPEAAGRFVDVSKAYRVLRDPIARGRYDTLLRAREAMRSPAAQAQAQSNGDRRDKGRLRCGDITCSLGQILNASHDGMQVLARKRFGQKEGKRLKFSLRDGAERLELEATIAWIMDVGRGKRRLGLQLELGTDAQRVVYWQFIRNAGHDVTSDFYGKGVQAA